MEYNKHPMIINGECIGNFECNFYMDYDIDFKTLVKGVKSRFYLINFNHLEDFNFFAIYKEVNLDGEERYYLIDSDFEEIACVPKIYEITKYEELIEDYAKNREAIISSTKKEYAKSS